MRESPYRYLPWLVGLLHLVGVGGLAVTIVTGFANLNQLLFSTYLLTLLVLRLDSYWFAAAVVGVAALYLTLAGSQHTLVSPYELLATDGFYLLIALVISRIQEARRARNREMHG